MPLPVIDDIDIAIAEAEENNAIASTHTLITNSNNIKYFNEPFSICDLTKVYYQFYTYWIDAIIHFSVTGIPHVNDDSDCNGDNYLIPT